MEKIKSLQKILKNSDEAILISSPENRRYFTDFPSSDGFLIVTSDDAVLFTDSRYIEAAQKTALCRASLVTKASKEIKFYFENKGISKILTERERLTVETADALKKTFRPCRVVPSKVLEKKINELRTVKSPDEINCIKKAQAIAEEAFRHILTFIKPGVTEKSIALELDFYMLSHGAEALSFETIAVTGKKTSMPHGVPDNTVVSDGDFVTMDFGAVYKGYHSDMTRTVAVGSISPEQKKIYEIVLAAQKSALEILKKGVPCKTADAAARDIIKENGYGEYFGHGTGHGVGIEIHEMPGLSPASDAVLESGNIVTVEPGIYIPDKFGVRIEDMALITDEGSQNLTCAPKELIVL
ncbi:MAG: M24 family metallopeptidase [Acutalibacteraceae bacterium]